MLSQLDITNRPLSDPVDLKFGSQSDLGCLQARSALSRPSFEIHPDKRE
jgi:hypothetical protein